MKSSRLVTLVLLATTACFAQGQRSLSLVSWSEDQILDGLVALRFADSAPEPDAVSALEQRLMFGENSEEFRNSAIEELRTLVMLPDGPISEDAARVLVIATRRHPETAQFLLRPAESAALPDNAARYIFLLTGMDTKLVDDRLLTLATGSTDEKSVAATNVLLRSKQAPDELLPHVVRHAQHPLFYGRYSLIQGLRQYEAKAIPFLPDLQEVRERLAVEATLPIEQLTVNVVRDGDTTSVTSEASSIALLDETIAHLTKLAEDGR